MIQSSQPPAKPYNQHVRICAPPLPPAHATDHLPQQTETRSAPSVRLPSADPAKTYLLLFVDPSINTTSPAYTGLHEIVANLRVDNSNNGTLTMTPANNTGTVAEALAPYVYPQVPPGGSAHQYTLLLFEQPAVLDVPVAYASFLPFPTNLLTRVNFPLLEFIQAVGLGKPVAANWFWEGPANATSGSATPSASATGKSALVSGTSATSSPVAAATGAAAAGRYGVAGLSAVLVPVVGGVAGALVF